MEYLIKASIVVILFYLCFSLLLKKETFFQHNRWFLLIGLIIALVFPFIVIPVYIAIEPVITPEVMETQVLLTQTIASNVATSQPEVTFDWAQLIPIVYGVGFIIFLMQFIMQFGSLALLLLKNPRHKDELFTYVIVKNNISPFSFFKWIVYNPNAFDENELDLILTHERVHAKQLHSIDLLIVQLACIIFWFNPLIWLYRKEVRQNLEYIADSKTQASSSDEKQYQHLLLKTSVANHNISLSNNFYNSLIKERIVMLKKSRSNKKKQWKYLLMLPLLAGLVMSMNTETIYVEANTKIETAENSINILKERIPKAILNSGIQNKEDLNSNKQKHYNNNKEKNKNKKPSKSIKKTSVNQPNKNTKNIAMAAPIKPTNQPVFIGDISTAVITKNTTDAELENIKKDLKKEGLTVKFKGVKRNKSGKITAIKIDAKSKRSSTNYQISSDDKAIKPIKIVFDSEKNSISIGNGHSIHGKNTFVFESEDGNHQILKSGSDSNTFMYSIDEDHEYDSEHETKVILRSNGIKGKMKKIKSNNSNVHVISGKKDGEVSKIIIDKDDDNKEIVIVNGIKGKMKRIKSNRDVHVISGKKDGEVSKIIINKDDNNKETVIVNGIKGNLVEGKENIVVKGKNKKVWVTNINDKDNMFVFEIDDNKKKIFVSNDSGKSPLFILDGKEVSKNKFSQIDSDRIESITVLKDKNAIDKYGKKAKDGVIIIKTKKN